MCFGDGRIFIRMCTFLNIALIFTSFGNLDLFQLEFPFLKQNYFIYKTFLRKLFVKETPFNTFPFRLGGPPVSTNRVASTQSGTPLSPNSISHVIVKLLPQMIYVAYGYKTYGYKNGRFLQDKKTLVLDVSVQVVNQTPMTFSNANQPNNKFFLVYIYIHIYI